MSSSRLPSVGDVIDDVFRVEEELDAGNFGAIYKVRDTLENRVLALKVLKPGAHNENELRARFEREARLVYSLRDRHVVEVYYYGETDRTLPYMAMEYLEGTDLRTLINHSGALKQRLAQRIALETLKGLSAAHELGIVHRDLKPANIFMVDDGGEGYVKVLDFGFAKAHDEQRGNDLTAASVVVGTPAYMAPESVHKKKVGPPADLYALGLILAEMISGQRAIMLNKVYDTIAFQASPAPVPLTEEVLKSPMRRVVEKACSKSVKHRYGSAKEMIRDLQRIKIGDGPGAGFSRATPLRTASVRPWQTPLSMDAIEQTTVPNSLGPRIPEIEREFADPGEQSDRVHHPDPTISADVSAFERDIADLSRPSTPRRAAKPRGPAREVAIGLLLGLVLLSIAAAVVLFGGFV